MCKLVLFLWLCLQCTVFVHSFTIPNVKDYDEIRPEDTVKPVCSYLYENCENWNCCEGYECAIARKGDEEREAFLFFCQDPKKNDTENMLGLNDFVFWNPDVFPD